MTPSRAGRTSSWGLWFRAVGTVLALTLLVGLIWSQGWQEILNSATQIPAGFLLMAFLLMIGSRFAVAARWTILVRGVGVDFKYRDALRITFAGLFASNFLPTTIGGDVVRLAAAIDLPEKRVEFGSTLVVDRLVGALGMTLMLPFGLAYIWIQGLPDLQQIFPGVFLIPGLAFALEPSLITRQAKNLRRAWSAITDLLRAWWTRPFVIGRALGFNLTHMALKFGAIWFLFTGLGEQLSVLRVGGVWSLVYFVTLVPVSINGLGVQEVSTGVFYSTFAGVAASNALTTALILRVIEMSVTLPGALALPTLVPDSWPARGHARTGTDKPHSGDSR